MAGHQGSQEEWDVKQFTGVQPPGLCSANDL